MKQAWIIAAVLSIGLNAGLLIRGCDRGGQPPGRPPELRQILDAHLERMADGLGLSEAQQQDLRAAHETLFPEILDQSRRLREMRHDLAQNYRGETVDPVAFRRIASEISKEQARLDSLIVDVMLYEAAVLTPEQRQQYERIMPWARRGGPPPRR